MAEVAKCLAKDKWTLTEFQATINSKLGAWGNIIKAETANRKETDAEVAEIWIRIQNNN
jgi:hypothetical protein